MGQTRRRLRRSRRPHRACGGGAVVTQTRAASSGEGRALGRDAGSGSATPRTIRAINDRITLELLLEHGALTRAQLAQLTGLSKPTATQLLSRLTQAGLITPRGTTTGAPGPNAQLYALNERAGLVPAVDVDEHRLAAAVVDLAGTVLARTTVATDQAAAADPVGDVRQLVGEICRRAGVRVRELTALVLSLSAAYDSEADRLTFAEHIPGWAQEG